ncbi:MAG: molybdopterin molybdotransferase MoeA [Alphaproteobacteria bacterium]|nr:molybdopterin molybdotransferase MoeA [Alphaproteobacteria bacterium]
MTAPNIATLPIESDCCAVKPGGKALIAVDIALEKGLSLAREVAETEALPLEQAIGRVLAENLKTDIPLPPFDNSGMDGYGFDSRSLNARTETRLKVVATVAAGDDISPLKAPAKGETIRIFTGAAVPEGVDVVVMQEHVTRDADHIIIHNPVTPGQNIRRRGEDAPIGSALLAKGAVLGARELAAIASVGHAFVTVRRRIRVALFCTGNELTQPGELLLPGKIYNSNRFMLKAALNAPFIELIDFGAVKDTPEKLRQTLTEAANLADIVVTTGGVSVGDEDHMVAQLQAAGGKIEVMKIAMKPGKPLTVGTLGTAIYIGLPGNPVAAFTTWKVIGANIAAKISGQSIRQSPRHHVRLAKGISRRAGRQEYRPARIVGETADGQPLVELLDNTFSAKIALICRADGFAVIPAQSQILKTGDRLDFIYLSDGCYGG